MTRPLKILFVSSEIGPFSKTGGLADVSESLPRALLSVGCDVRKVTPLYKCVHEKVRGLKTESFPVKHSYTGSFDVLEHIDKDDKTYFIKKDPLFFRDGLYGTLSGDYHDNAFRFSFFSRAAVVLTEAIGFVPDIIHCNDWHTALIPFYLKKIKGWRGMRSLLTIHNIAFQGTFKGFFIKRKIGFRAALNAGNDLDMYGKINFLKAGIMNADLVNTVSRKYAKEITTAEYGCGLEKCLLDRKHDLVGIPNGVDYDKWDPGHDGFIRANFNRNDLENKVACKKDLMEEAGLPTFLEKPVIGYIGRLAYQKGIDMIAEVIDKIMNSDVFLVLLGEGDALYERILKKMADKYPGKIKFFNEFNEKLAHKIEAGADILLMPSRYEPCGLNQMYSIRYGTIPVVRATGGLDDVIADCEDDPVNGNGFKFDSPEQGEFLKAIKRAVEKYGDKVFWKKLMANSMACDFSWERSAGEYLNVYERILDRK